MIQLYIRRKFAAAHFLPGHPKCGGMHGHSWLVEVWMEGDIDHETGMVVDFGEVKSEIDLLDHITLNDVLPSKFLPPTAENLVRYFLHYIPSAYKVRVWESDNAYAEDWNENERPLESYVKEDSYARL